MNRDGELRLSTGMRLRATASGWTYTVQGIDPERVVARGPHGSLGVDRDELATDVRAGRIEVLSWP